MSEEKAEVQEPEIKPADTSIRDAISEALDSEEAAEEVSEVAVESEAAETTEEPGEAEKPVDAAAEAPAEATEAVEQTTEKSEDDSSEEALDAPAHWALEDQKTFRALDPKAQKFLLGRSKDMEAAHTKRSQEIAPLRKSIEKWQPYLDKLGATADQAFETLIAAEYILRTGTEAQKRDAIGRLAKDYGISFEEPKANGADQDFLTSDIQKAVQPLQEQVGQLQSNLRTRDMQAQQATLDQLAGQIQTFRDQKTEAGQTAHPYFDEVRDEMTRLAQADQLAGRTSDLKTLYDNAIKLVPTVWEKLQAAQQHAAKKQQQREQKEKVKKAKSAGVSVTGVSSAPKEQPKSLRATIEEAAAGGL